MTDKNNMIHELQFNNKNITLLGTAHVSKESAELVKETIESIKPDSVCVELCEPRFQSIRQKKKWQEMDIVKVIKEKKAFLLLSNLLLASFQKRIADQFGVKPGQEMIQAIDSGEALGAQIHLADREIRITLARAWRIMSIFDKFKILFHFMLSMGDVSDITEDDIEKMKQEDVLESLLVDVGKKMPVIKNILIDERDQYLCQKIKTAPGNSIVAVVGAGHVAGIKKYWERDITLAPLEAVPDAGKLGGVLKWGIPGAILLVFMAGFFYGGSKTGSQMLIQWVLANGILAGIGAIAAFAHPLTILSAIFAAPLTSLNPMIAAGWVSGLVEAFIRKPKVIDFENLQSDIQSAKGFWRNKITKILLVVVFTNIGSMLGTFIALPLMARLF